ncbi:MAG: glycosyltransferase family 39 protein [Candidatus Limnocylindrales bacterium]
MSTGSTVDRAAPPVARKHAAYIGALRSAVGAVSLAMPLVAIVIGGVSLRLWQINAFGYNSDEAVYAGQAAGMVGDADLQPFFPVFRAHPLLFQFVLALSFNGGVVDVVGRYVAVAIGAATIVLTYMAGALMFGRRVGLIAALFLAVMPYHVVVTRQVLLDGPMTFCATLAMYLMARHARTGRVAWLYAAAAAIGLAFEAKETAIIFIAAIYTYLSLSPEIFVRLRDIAAATFSFVLIILPFPISLYLAGGGGATRTQQYLVWQLLRRPNHDLAFYPTILPGAIGPILIIVALVGLVAWRRGITWRERLLVAWCAVPLLFFEIWPVKGFQYPVVIAPALCILAASALVRLARADLGRLPLRGRLSSLSHSPAVPARLSVALTAVLALSLTIPALAAVNPSASDQFLAGSGGVPGGREVGAWIRTNVPPGAQMLAIGPSMANIVQFYGHRRVYGLSVSSNPLHRNPSYDPIPNPDAQIRANVIQYLVWDSYSGSRSTFFADALMRFADRYHGRSVYTHSVDVVDADGRVVSKPVIVVYEVRP